MGFVANFIRFPAVQKFRKSVKTWQSCREFKGGNFFEMQCISYLCCVSIWSIALIRTICVCIIIGCQSLTVPKWC